MAYYWVSWLSLIYIIFFGLEQHKINQVIKIILLLNIILIHFQIEFGYFVGTLPYTYSFFLVWIFIFKYRFTIKHWISLICIVLAYTGLRYILITSPIWLFLNAYLLIHLALILMVIFIERNLLTKLLLYSTSLLTGEILFAYHVRIIDWNVILGEPMFFVGLYISTLTIIIHHQLINHYKMSKIFG
ncbi:hypothetical protein [Amphibacillus cookii]|uniref:YphA family membrane protein n=1 Tax=Amphibacillus cookii TaxID=767787 RepID=UPI00195D2FE5|nr:hypothetical protein [Amphibacillus cookii]MBM7542506.1 hypothetical protein [Amphibacillus cookii]